MRVTETRVLALLVACLVLFVCATFETWSMTGGIAALSFLLVLWRNRRTVVEPKKIRPRWQRWAMTALGVIGLVAAVSSWRLTAHFSETINILSFGIDMLAHSCVFGVLLLWAMRPKVGHPAMLGLGLCVLLCCVAAGGVSQYLGAQTVVGITTAIGFAIASQIVLSARYRQKNGETESERISHAGAQPFTFKSLFAGTGQLYSLLALSLIMIATSAVARGTNEVLPGVRDILQEQLKSRFDPIAQQSTISGTRYVNGSNLGDVRRHLEGDPQGIALRVYSDRAPGYLRGKVFDLYRSSVWKTTRNSANISDQAFSDRILRSVGDAQTPLEQANRSELSRFDFNRVNRRPTVPIEVILDPQKGNRIFLPLATDWLEARSGELIVGHHDVIRMGVDPRYPYVAGVATEVTRKQVTGLRRQAATVIPRRCADAVARKAQVIFDPDDSPREKAVACEDYFQANYGYTLQRTRAPRGVDPIAAFLDQPHPAHCEYFATATALLLRHEGIPTRYVTGYVADEYNDENERWLARNGDAHAWVEAFDDETGQWFPVESTPGRTYSTIDPFGVDEDETVDSDIEAADDLDESDTLFGYIWGWISSQRATDPLVVIFRYLQLPLFFGLVGLLWYRRHRAKRGGDDPLEIQSRKMLRRVDRLTRKQRLIRNRSETLHQFASRIEQAAENQRDNEPQLRSIAQWYRQYAGARYSGQLPEAFAA